MCLFGQTPDLALLSLLHAQIVQNVTLRNMHVRKPQVSMWLYNMHVPRETAIIAMTCRPTWMGNDTIVAAVVPEGVGPAPVKPPSAIGPKVQDNTSGKKAQARTYQDLLKDAYDEDTFEYYTNTELMAVQVGVCITCSRPQCCDHMPRSVV